MRTTLLYRKYLLACLLLFVAESAFAVALRRPISPSQPAWIIHIDVWNYADPQKIIDMVPEDVRPYVIFNIATSSSDEKSADGPAIYDSWMKVCAQNRVWTMIQCASGYFNRMPDTPDDISAYQKYYDEYPNFLGFNFAEQYWGFDTEGGVTFDNRLQLFAKLLELSKTYGGYLAVSFADSYHNANKMPVAYMKRNSDINAFLSTSPEHFLCFEKYTQKKNFLDIESQCLGAWLSGFAGGYGIRFDSSGWVEAGVKPDANESDTEYTIGASDFVRAAGAIPVAEHMMLTGQTIMDGPELSWTECSTEGSTSSADGYTRRNWEWMPQWNAVTLGLFRKILDGTIRIMTKEEVMNRTKVCVVSGGNGSDNNSYRTPAALFDGLYRNAKDYGGLQGRDANHWLNNRWWMKSTGRYPTIPTMLSAGSLTDIGSYVSNTTDKQEYLNGLFAEEYTGDIYAGRHENGWVTYNPYQYDDATSGGIRTLSRSTARATGNIPFQYNTCTSVDLDYAPYSLGIMKEYADKVTFYLSNYEGGTDIIKINGAGSKPAYTASSGSVTESWADNVYTLTVEHSGEAVELTISCSGSATGRKTDYTTAAILVPDAPAAYTGVLQYEAELADYKNSTIRKSGYEQGHDGYKGQGFAEMTGSSSSLRYQVSVPEAGYYELSLRYQTSSKGSMAVYVGDDERTMNLATSDGEWNEATVPVRLAAGAQTIDMTNTGGKATFADCIQLKKINVAHYSPDAETGEYHASFADLHVSGDLTFDASTGELTLPANSTGSLILLLDEADFSCVTNVSLSKSGNDDIFATLWIGDAGNVSVNSGSNGKFYSSRYNLNFASYQASAASQHVYKLEWAATASESARTMTLQDILISDSPYFSIDESSGSPEVVSGSISSKAVSYSRTLEAPGSGSQDAEIDGEAVKLYTVCLPYDPPTDLGIKYYTLIGVSDNTLNFSEVTIATANTPYLVAVTSQTEVGTTSKRIVDFDADINTKVSDGYQLKGTLRGLSNADAAAEGAYILQSGNQWGKVTTENTAAYIPPFRAYIVGSAHAGTRLIGFIDDGNTTAIQRIQTIDTDGTEHWYDLNGRPITKPTRKGVYIKNGKKYVINN